MVDRVSETRLFKVTNAHGGLMSRLLDSEHYFCDGVEGQPLEECRTIISKNPRKVGKITGSFVEGEDLLLIAFGDSVTEEQRALFYEGLERTTGRTGLLTIEPSLLED